MKKIIKKWSTPKFGIGLLKNFLSIIFCKEFIVFAIFTLMMRYLMLKDKADFRQWIVYGAVAIAFIFQESITELISKKTNLDIKANIGAEAKVNVSGDINKAITDTVDKIKNK